MSENNSKTKVLVIGLDGATWTVLRPMMEEGHMPNLKRLVENGVSGELISTIPAHSGPAWTSFMTGKNPGKHGVFGFVKAINQQNNKKGYRNWLYNSNDIKAKTIFHILSEAKKCVGAINIPVTYPPFVVNGFIVSQELFTPGTDLNFVFPNDLFNAIGYDWKDYLKDITFVKLDGNKEEYLNSLIRADKEKKKLVLKLMDYFDWDFIAVNFTSLDHFQHRLWHYIDTNHSRYNKEEAEKLNPLIASFFQNLDSAIGELKYKAGQNSRILIISDHGFGPLEKFICVNNLFMKEGILRLNKRIKKDKSLIFTLQHKLRGFLQRHFLLYRIIKQKVKQLSGQGKLDAKLEPKLYIKYKSKAIDWKNTKVFCLGETATGISINNSIVDDSTREYESLRNKVISILKLVKDPKTHKLLEIEIYKREDIFYGPYLNQAPDLVVCNNFEYTISNEIGRDTDIVRPAGRLSGFHRRNGILVAWGNCFKSNSTLKNTKIIDIAPTILYLLGLPILEDMDGRVLSDAIKDDYLNQNPIKYQRALIKEVNQENNVYSEEDMAKIEQRLLDLGYLG